MIHTQDILVESLNTFLTADGIVAGPNREAHVVKTCITTNEAHDAGLEKPSRVSNRLYHIGYTGAFEERGINVQGMAGVPLLGQLRKISGGFSC